MALHSPHALTSQHAIKYCFVSEAYSDLIIKCKNAEFRVHKAIICPQCKFFEKACKKEWAKKIATEASHPTTIPHRHSVSAMSAMIEYFYTENYDHALGDLGTPTWEREMRFHIDVYILADKYNIERLRQCSASNIRVMAKTKRSGLPKIIREVYEKNDIYYGIRDIFAEIGALHAKWLFTVLGEEFGSLMMDIPVFGRDMAEFMCGARKRVYLALKAPRTRAGKRSQLHRIIRPPPHDPIHLLQDSVHRSQSSSISTHASKSAQTNRIANHGHFSSQKRTTNAPSPTTNLQFQKDIDQNTDSPANPFQASQP
ncbi:ATP-dependent RNA helicase [Venturia nashicola]|uniref:ATP-dependent RNA helicase n=1 Tax=Venturia nashicola TaxID=86259 RepID=A0A4Z1P3Q4_9PEZI|nr:ATP-dependent RNA helicase [Venturia nashicola]TLD36109.1 ATP-dependent RNA helicase [Venturia nashicola]